MWLDFLEVLYFFFPGWLCHFKGLFIPVWLVIHRLKILLVTSWQLTSRTVSDISCHSLHSICQSFYFFQHEFIWFKFIQVKQVDLETSSATQSLFNFMHWSSFHSLLRTYERSTCNKSNHVAWNNRWCQKMKGLNLTPAHKKLMVCLYQVIAKWVIWPKLRNRASTTTNCH